jgi:micrococcal nuclease
MIRKSVYLVFILTCLTVFSGCEQNPRKDFIDSKHKSAAEAFTEQGYANILVTRAVDGDTLVLANGQRLRLIGIDTPEMHESGKLHRDAKRMQQDIETIKALGRRSYEFTKGLVEGKRVRLEFDVERKDRYGRLLAYAYLEDGTFVNAEIVRQGYASLMTYPPNVKYADLFLKLYQQARENKRGLWQ